MTHDRTIRLAITADAPELARLRWRFLDETDGASMPLEEFGGTFRQFLDEILASGRWAVVVAEQGRRLVGMAYAQLVLRVPNPGDLSSRWAYITSVYVEPDWRRCGVGTALIDTAVQWSRAHGAHEIRLWPAAGSVRFYEQAGFVAGEAPMIWRPRDTMT